MFSGWENALLAGLITTNQILTAGIAITAFSLLLYAFSFNLRDRVARSFAIILLCVVIIFTAEAIGSAATSPYTELLLGLQWLGLVFLPAGYLHLSDALLVTAGRPSRGRRRLAVRVIYIISLFFLVLLISGQLVGPIMPDRQPAPHLQRTIWTEIFSIFYIITMIWAWINFARAFQRMLTRSGRRRMLYLMAGATAPALGSYPYLLFGSGIASQFPLVFWTTATLINIIVAVLIVVMAYSVAFFGVSWPDRVIKSRLFKWLMRGPATASLVLAVMTIVRRMGVELYGIEYNAVVPVCVVATILIVEHGITLASPVWERLFFFGGDHSQLVLLQNIEERLLTQSDLRQFLEAILAAVRDHMQSSSAFVATMDDSSLSLLITAGRPINDTNILTTALQVLDEETPDSRKEFKWDGYWILPLHQHKNDLDIDQIPPLLGILGVAYQTGQSLESEQRQALWLLANRAAMALEDRKLQQRIFRSLEDLEPQVELIQRMRAAGRYDSKASLLSEEFGPDADVENWVKDALNHYWGGPKLTQSPLLSLTIVQEAANNEFEGNAANALRAVLRRAVEQVKPEGERRFTTEWILYNILDMKFIEGRKVRDVANRLAMSEADLYRKQRVAVEAVAKTIQEMENQAQAEKQARRS
jgi:hypothetical protein